MNRNLLFRSLVLCSLVLFSACADDAPEAIDEATEATVQDHNQAELEGDALLEMAEGEALAPGSGKADHHPSGQHLRAGECVQSVVFDTTRGPGSTLAKRITITFDPSITCRDGKRRSGQVVISWFGFIREENMQAGRLVNVRTVNYSVNGIQVKAYRTIGTLISASEPPVQTIVARDTIVRPNGEGIIYHNSNRQRRWLQGFFTPNPFDDVFLLSGSANGQGRRGEAYTATITTPVRIERACRWPVSGVVRMTGGERPAREIDFGAGTCDNLATLRVGDRSKSIQLP